MADLRTHDGEKQAAPICSLTAGERLCSTALVYIPEFWISRSDSSQVHALTWTKAEWLDSLDVQFAAKPGGGCVATASFYATGFLPTSVPLAPLLNIGLAWIPFASPGPRNEMLQEFRLRALKGLLTKKLEEEQA